MLVHRVKAVGNRESHVWLLSTKNTFTSISSMRPVPQGGLQLFPSSSGSCFKVETSCQPQSPPGKGLAHCPEKEGECYIGEWCSEKPQLAPKPLSEYHWVKTTLKNIWRSGQWFTKAYTLPHILLDHLLLGSICRNSILIKILRSSCGLLVRSHLDTEHHDHYQVIPQGNRSLHPPQPAYVSLLI